MIFFLRDLGEGEGRQENRKIKLMQCSTIYLFFSLKIGNIPEFKGQNKGTSTK